MLSANVQADEATWNHKKQSDAVFSGDKDKLKAKSLLNCVINFAVPADMFSLPFQQCVYIPKTHE